VSLIALIDYGAGNLTSVRKGFAAAGVNLVTPSTPRELDDAAAIVVPGVGHFAATLALHDGWREAILRRVEAGSPLLGICLGMQWLFEASEESPDAKGLGLLRGSCIRVRVEHPLKVPHVGWNTIDTIERTSLLADIPDGSFVYFTHGYAAPVTADCIATTTHGKVFAAAVQREQVCGVQFHPEKSSTAGLQILRNFARLARS
jgi:glutamine amidotransferase